MINAAKLQKCVLYRLLLAGKRWCKPSADPRKSRNQTLAWLGTQCAASSESSSSDRSSRAFFPPVKIKHMCEQRSIWRQCTHRWWWEKLVDFQDPLCQQRNVVDWDGAISDIETCASLKVQPKSLLKGTGEAMACDFQNLLATNQMDQL